MSPFKVLEAGKALFFGVTVASLEFDKESSLYRIRFRFAGRSFKRSLTTGNAKIARSTLARVDETLALIANRRLEVPGDVDPAEFILSEGTRSEPTIARRVLSLGELCKLFQDDRVPGAKEASTIKTEDLHVRTLLRVLKKSTYVQSIKNADLQRFILTRLRQAFRSR